MYSCKCYIMYYTQKQLFCVYREAYTLKLTYLRGYIKNLSQIYVFFSSALKNILMAKLKVFQCCFNPISIDSPVTYINNYENLSARNFVTPCCHKIQIRIFQFCHLWFCSGKLPSRMILCHNVSEHFQDNMFVLSPTDTTCTGDILIKF